jgi:hypothetical protein
MSEFHLPPAPERKGEPDGPLDPGPVDIDAILNEWGVTPSDDCVSGLAATRKEKRKIKQIKAKRKTAGHGGQAAMLASIADDRAQFLGTIDSHAETNRDLSEKLEQLKNNNKPVEVAFRVSVPETKTCVVGDATELMNFSYCNDVKHHERRWFFAWLYEIAVWLFGSRKYILQEAREKALLFARRETVIKTFQNGDYNNAVNKPVGPVVTTAQFTRVRSIGQPTMREEVGDLRAGSNDMPLAFKSIRHQGVNLVRGLRCLYENGYIEEDTIISQYEDINSELFVQLISINNVSTSCSDALIRQKIDVASRAIVGLNQDRYAGPTISHFTKEMAFYHLVSTKINLPPLDFPTPPSDDSSCSAIELARFQRQTLARYELTLLSRTCDVPVASTGPCVLAWGCMSLVMLFHNRINTVSRRSWLAMLSVWGVCCLTQLFWHKWISYTLSMIGWLFICCLYVLLQILRSALGLPLLITLIIVKYSCSPRMMSCPTISDIVEGGNAIKLKLSLKMKPTTQSNMRGASTHVSTLSKFVQDLSSNLLKRSYSLIKGLVNTLLNPSLQGIGLGFSPNGFLPAEA